jgi:protein-disulfide isomerase
MALAAECAAEQASFESFHDTLFAWQAHLDTLDLSTAAASAGIKDVSAFSECLRASRYADRVRADTDDGRRLQVRGTPTLLVNGNRFDGNVGLEVLDSVIRAELQRDRNR